VSITSFGRRAPRRAWAVRRQARELSGGGALVIAAPSAVVASLLQSVLLPVRLLLPTAAPGVLSAPRARILPGRAKLLGSLLRALLRVLMGGYFLRFAPPANKIPATTTAAAAASARRTCFAIPPMAIPVPSGCKPASLIQATMHKSERRRFFGQCDEARAGHDAGAVVNRPFPRFWG
jgi:hypothetical protein